MMRSANYLAVAVLLTVAAPARGADVVVDWDALMVDAIRADNSGPTLSTRNLAIMHTAIYDSVNSVERSHQPYLVQLDALPGTSAEAAAASAAYEVMKVLYQPFRAQADALFAAWRDSAPQDASTTNGLALGKQVAERALQNRASDGASTEVPYIPSDAPGQWRRTPPFFRPPLTPQWRYVKPFCLPGLERFLPPPPPSLDSAEYAESLNFVKAIGGMNSTVRTAEEALIANFWSDFSYTSMPPGHWDLIAETVSQAHKNTLPEKARLFALLSLAQADGAIVCWEAKYRYNFWRPVTAIQRADEDGNPSTEADPNWTQLLASPPFPSYPSGHSTFSKASAQVLTHFYGTDAITFSTTGDATPGVVRTYHSLAACADEVGLSRIYGGFHFPFDNTEGKKSGGKVGDFVSVNFLLPNASLPLVVIDEVKNGLISLRVHGHIGRSLIVESSSDLRAWTTVSTTSASTGGALVEDQLSFGGAPARFYRVKEAP